MRILAFSDLHRNRDIASDILAASREADVVIGAGDLATCGMGLDDTAQIFKALSVPTIFIPGNHDDIRELRAAFAENPKTHVLHGSTVEIGASVFFGLGFEIPARTKEPWSSSLDEKEAETLLARCPVGCVLVTHSPPFGVADIQANGLNAGSFAIRRAVELLQPRIHLCGHIHNAWGMTGSIGASAVFNLGPTLRWFDV